LRSSADISQVAYYAAFPPPRGISTGRLQVIGRQRPHGVDSFVGMKTGRPGRIVVLRAKA
jgi:hypothetical protein